MQGDKILVQEHHIRAAEAISDILLPRVKGTAGRYAISIGGESGSGKSELAVATSEALEKQEISTIILQQDDYFVYPPHTNDSKRRQDITRVGLSEVRLDLLDDHVHSFLSGATTIEKPLVLYQEDRIVSETLPLANVDVMIVEGTYTTLLKNVNSRIFIDRTNKQTKAARLKRNREPADAFLEQVLQIEHDIISTHKHLADILVTSSFAVVRQGTTEGAGNSPTDDGRLSKEVIAEGNLQTKTL